MDLLVTHNIVKRYANHTALDDVSISVPQGSIYGLLGPNGAGKTSLIRIINQITGPDSGSIELGGHKLEPKDAEMIGYLPEERGLYKKMKEGEQALYLARLKGMGRKEAIAKLKLWFEKFEMQSWWNKKVEELSKGMQQKVQFVVTVLHEPKLLILDEPFSGFDPINASLIKQEILALKEKGSTIIFSTHNMGSVEEMCDHIALINRSKKILEGSVSDIRKAYRSNIYEVEFRGQMIGFTNALWTGFELVGHKQEGDVIKARVRLLKDHSVNQLLQAVLPVTEIISLKEVIPGMNDIFISKVKEENMELPDNLTE